MVLKYTIPDEDYKRNFHDKFAQPFNMQLAKSDPTFFAKYIPNVAGMISTSSSTVHFSVALRINCSGIRRASEPLLVNRK